MKTDQYILISKTAGQLLENNQVLVSWNWKDHPVEDLWKNIVAKFSIKSGVTVKCMEDCSFTLSMTIPKNEINDSADGMFRSVVSHSLQSMIPESVSSIWWDYQVISRNSEGVVVQVFAVTQAVSNYLEALKSAFGVAVEYVESVPLVVAKSTSSSAYSVVLCHFFDQFWLQENYDGYVIATRSVSTPLSVAAIAAALEEMKPEVGSVSEGILVGKWDEVVGKTLTEKLGFPWKIAAQTTDMLLSLPTEIKSGNDNEVLNPAKKQSDTKIQKTESKKTPSTMKNEKSTEKLQVVGLLLVILLAVGVGGWYLSQALKPKSPNSTTQTTEMPTSSPSTVATPSETPATVTQSSSVDIASAQITILNGTKTAGYGAAAKSVLELAGFTVVSVGNNSVTELTRTEIRYSQVIEGSPVLEQLDTVLSETYDGVVLLPQSDQTLSAAQITVVVGPKKE